MAANNSVKFRDSDAGVALTTDSSSESPCVCVWETASWMQLKAYKKGVCERKCLTLLSQSYVLAAQKNNPLLYVWDISKEQMHSKIVCPSSVTALTASPNGLYCVAACSETIYIWQVGTGNLLCMFSKHFQPVRCLNFTDDSSHLISGADDNLVSVWPLIRLLSHSRGNETDNVSPKYTWSDHSLPISSIHVGRGGIFSRVVTSSYDHTCKLWDLSTGHLLRSFHFDLAILSVVMDAAEYRLFAGGFDSKIYVVNLFSQTSARQHVDEHSKTACFVGHSKQVVSLSLSMDGSTLLSGSKDCTARVWDVYSRQCLKVLEHKGSVENVQIHPRFQNFDIKPSKNSLPVIASFKKTPYKFHSQQEESIPVRIFDRKNCYETPPTRNGLLESVLRENCEDNEMCGGESELSKSELKEKLNESKQLNQTLYGFVASKLVSEVREQAQHS